jgi:hypothetical protein
LLLLFIFYTSYKNNKITIENYQNDTEFINFINNHIFYNEKDEIIDHKIFEIDEQYQSYQYIEPNDIVLELGGRYGTVSTVITPFLR